MNELITENLTQSEIFLICMLDERYYGFPILSVDGIISIPEIVKMPKMPKYFKGIINIRGQIIPVADMRLLLSMAETKYNEQTCIVLLKTIINSKEKIIGFVVDTVSEVFDIPKSQIELPASTGLNFDSSYLAGIGHTKDKIVMILDINKVLEMPETVDFMHNELKEIEEFMVS